MSGRESRAVLDDRPGERADRSSTVRRLIGITTSLVGTQAATSILGFGFWTLAARQFSVEAVGVAGAAVSLMTLLATLGTVGLGTLLIARLPHEPPGQRRVLVRTALLVAGTTTLVICLLVPAVAIRLLQAGNLSSIAGDPGNAVLFAVGSALMAVTIVLDQAVLTIGNGTLQLERNVVASGVKLAALAVLTMFDFRGGMTVFAAWTIGSLLSLPLTAWRSRRGTATERGPLVDLSSMRGVARSAAGHHALNITLMIPLLLLPVLVTVLLSPRDNGVFTGALQVTGFVFALPYAVSVALFAAAEGDARQVIERMRLTIPFGLGVSLLANAALFPIGPQVLQIFGVTYAQEGSLTLRILVLAGLPFVVKDHFVALRRVQGRTGQATGVLTMFSVVELLAAWFGAQENGIVGLSAAWVGVLYLEALVLAVPLLLAGRVGARARREEWVASFDPLPPPLLGPGQSPPDGLPRIYPGGRPEPWHRGPSAGETGTLLLPPSPAFLPASMGGQGAGPMTVPIRIEGLRSLYPSAPPAGTIGSRPDVLAPPPPALPQAMPAHVGPQRRHGRAEPQDAAPERHRDAIVGPLILVMSLGLLCIGFSVAQALSQHDYGGTPQILYVAGLATIFLPAAVAVILPGLSTGNRVLMVVCMGLLLQLSRVVLYPTRFMFHDELLHANVLRLIETTGRLFGFNPLLPITSYYPGLEIATSAVQSVTGLPPHTAAVIVELAARTVLMLAVVLVVQEITGSNRVGAAAALVYACNPQMLFFNSQFSYQTIALPLAFLTVYLFLSRNRSSPLGMIAPVCTAAAVVMSHHVTSGLMVIAFLVWWMLDLVVRRGRGSESGALATMAASSGGFLALSIANPGNTLATYLGAIAVSSGDAVAALAEGNNTKQTFENSAGVGPQPWEQLLILAALALTMLVLLPALWKARIWLRYRVTAAVLLTLTALLYPLIPGGHLTVSTAEVGDRSAGFVYLGVGFVVGAWLWRRPGRTLTAVVFGTGATVAFIGGVILGAGPTSQQLPGPFQVSADARSIDGTSIAAADWERQNLPADSVIYADRVGGLLAAAYGHQFTVRHISTNVDASRLLLDPDYTSADVALIRRLGIEYVIADRRDAIGLPNQQVYIESGEFGGQNRTQPVPLAALTKFDDVPGVKRIYDNGQVSVYDVRGLRG